MSRNAISILQETMVKDHKAIPIYEFFNVGNVHHPRFRCKVTVDGREFEATCINKKDAKQSAAEKALSVLNAEYIEAKTVPNNESLNVNKSNDQLDPEVIGDPSISNFEDKNYIGLLSEYCVKNKLGQPEYFESYDQVVGGNFKIVCSLQKLESIGLGANKKIAKKIAAEKMFYQITKDPSVLQISKQALQLSDFQGNLSSKSEIDNKEATTQKNDDKAAPRLLEIEDDKIPELETKNYIGLVNEYCVKHKLPLPSFIEPTIQGSCFKVYCSLGSLQTEGQALNKKKAKKIAAAKLYFKIIKSDVLPAINMSSDNKQYEKKVSTTYACLIDSVTAVKEKKTEPEAKVEKLDIDVPDSTENIGISEEDKIGLKYGFKNTTIITMQENPFLVKVTDKDLELSIMGSGKTKEEAIQSAFTKLSDCKNSRKIF